MRTEITKQSDVHPFKHFVKINTDGYKGSIIRYL